MAVDGRNTVDDERTPPVATADVVLLVDDNALQAATRQAILQRGGYIVYVSLDPAIALRQIRQNEFAEPIGAVISDHIMPQMSGSEFVRELRHTHADMPVMVLSGMDDAEREYAGLNVRFLRKPLAPGLLLINLQALLQVEEAEGVA
jgi:DNA-binding response OmpR family regulator